MAAGFASFVDTVPELSAGRVGSSESDARDFHNMWCGGCCNMIHVWSLQSRAAVCLCCVLGGMTTFLFCNVFVSGLKVTAGADLDSRRNRVILAIAMGLGLGVAMVPYIVADFRASSNTAPFWPCTGPFRDGKDCTDGEKGIRQGMIIFLSTPYCIGTIVALVLNLILPADMEVLRAEDTKTGSI